MIRDYTLLRFLRTGAFFAPGLRETFFSRRPSSACAANSIGFRESRQAP